MICWMYFVIYFTFCTSLMCIVRSKTEIFDVGQKATSMNVCRMPSDLWARISPKTSRGRGSPSWRSNDELDGHIRSWAVAALNRDNWREGKETYALLVALIVSYPSSFRRRVCMPSVISFYPREEIITECLKCTPLPLIFRLDAKCHLFVRYSMVRKKKRENHSDNGLLPTY